MEVSVTPIFTPAKDQLGNFLFADHKPPAPNIEAKSFPVSDLAVFYSA
jgi:hypothetical protein